MGFKDLNISEEYRIPRDNIISDFYVPLLGESIEYDRCAGFFSSDALIDISYGVSGLVKNGGKIRLIVSPNLSKDDYEAINKGYELREKIISNRLLNSLQEYNDYFSKERLNLVAQLIAKGVLDIKIAFSIVHGKLGLYHEKMGLMYDTEDNIVAFSGSMNETNNALTENYETIDVFTSWNDERRVKLKMDGFRNIWKNKDTGAKTFPFPEAVKEKILTYNYKTANYNIDYEEQMKIIKEYEKEKLNTPRIPENIKLRNYQKEAISNWKKSNFIGIFDMATGTGKTITAIAAILELLETHRMKMGIIICVPYQHLVDQWYDDLIQFNFHPIMGYSTSPQKKWKENLKKQVFDYSMGIRKGFCFVTTNASFTTKSVQDILSKCKKDMLIVVDEAHNFGSKRNLKYLTDRYNYRLALSATLERHHDIEGTEKLLDYFKQKCIEYSMEKAIDEGMLTHYYYHPIKVYLDEDELDEYNRLSSKIAKAIKTKKDGTIIITEEAKRLMIMRSRVIAGARNKIQALRKQMNAYKDSNYILVYCGATKYHEQMMDKDDYYNKADSDDLRQIEEVERVLSFDLGMRISQYTSEETMEQRRLIIDDFKEGNIIQALVAIKCLDEGVNIPNIRTAFILASSTNPKEYIQRRGRVLRLAPGKEYATIYDFVTLPRDINRIRATDDRDYDVSLIKREIRRVHEFAYLSENERESNELINDLMDVYGSEIIDDFEKDSVI